MKRVLTDEEALMEREGHGRFNLRQSAEIHPAPPTHRRTNRGPKSVITNTPTRDLTDRSGVDRTKYRPKLTKDEKGNDVRIMVPVGAGLKHIRLSAKPLIKGGAIWKTQ